MCDVPSETGSVPLTESQACSDYSYVTVFNSSGFFNHQCPLRTHLVLDVKRCLKLVMLFMAYVLIKILFLQDF